MSMTPSRGSRAAESEIATGERVAGEVGAINAHKRGFRRFLPKHADGWSVMFALIFTFAVPIWFTLAPMWNPNYVPVRPWVWAVPWILAWIYFMTQMLFLLVSAINSDKIGILDMSISLVALLSVFGTIIVLLVLAALSRYRLGGFQQHEMMAYFSAAFFELAFTAWVRFLVNRRTFATVGNGDATS